MVRRAVYMRNAGGSYRRQTRGRSGQQLRRRSAAVGSMRPTDGSSITTTVQGGMCGDARRAARRLAWERLARSLLSCVSSSHRSRSAGPNRSRGSISRTTRYTRGLVIRGIFFPPILLQAQQKSAAQQAEGHVVIPARSVLVAGCGSRTRPAPRRSAQSRTRSRYATGSRPRRPGSPVGVSSGALDRW